MRNVGKWIWALVVVVVVLAGCKPTPTPPPTPTPTATPDVPTPTPTPEPTPVYLDPSASIDARVEDLLARMSLAEKIGQMTLVEKNSIPPEDVATYFIGGVLSGGGGYPSPNTPENWAAMVGAFQDYALQTPLGIPIIYGVDAVHGHAAVYGATVFPHQIGLGATRDPDLVERIGRVTAEEMVATGIYWNYAPVVAVPQDIRWGRTYEAYSEDTELVSTLARAYIRGLQGDDLSAPDTVLATPKHFVGDGGTAWGTSRASFDRQRFMLDQGDMQVDEETLRAIHLPPYQAAIDAGARSIMVSFSSWNGVKMHANRYLLTEVLKGEMGFEGFLVSDWGAIDQISSDPYQNVVTSINAGLDMIMVPYDYKRFIAILTRAVEQGDVPMERIDDAVRRILRVKFALGLFEHPYANEEMMAQFGSAEHRELAREAVRKSLVLLKNEGDVLPLSKDLPLILVAGEAADDIGIQCGGWTIEWQGKAGDITEGTTIREGIEAAVDAGSTVRFNRWGRFEDVEDGAADVGIVVVGEEPYAEGVGDRADLSLSEKDLQTIERVRAKVKTLVVILVSGRPMILGDALDQADALVAAWLPGSEGAGVADVLFGDYPFSGTLPYIWPRSMDQLPFDFANLPTEGPDAPLFPRGYGLTTAP